jgi:glycerophosphoryl diester phosphodiesterase
MSVIDGKTASPAYVFNVPDGPDGPHYDIQPLVTVGDEVPLLEGEFGEFTTSDSETYPMVGIPDGLGYTEIDGFKYVWMNHELSSGVITDNAEGIVNGARVSLYVFDENWNAIGGKNLIEDVEVDGVTYSLNSETGNYEDADGNVYNFAGHDNFSRFCSGYLASQGFVDENGESIPIYFAPEEVDAGAAVAVTPDGTASPIEGFGLFSKEQVYPASEYRADNSDKTVMLSMEDENDGEIYMYVGDQTEADPNGFNDTTDSLYVLRVKDAEGNIFGFEDMAENVELTAEWVSVPDLVTLNRSPEVLSSWVNTEFNTLDGEPPLVIGHRGASGERPEHTLESYKLAIEQGADFIEPDLVPTKDGVLVARHENEISGTTDVADRPEFADRFTTKMVDGVEISGWFTEDFTLEELKTLRAKERIPGVRPENTEFDGLFEVPTLEEVIDLVKEVEAETGKKIGIYPETKHPTFFEKEGTFLDGTPINIDTSQILIDTLVENDFTDPSRIFIQSFEIENLLELQNKFLPEAGIDLPLVQLLGDFTESEGSFSYPYDVVYNFGEGNANASPEVYTDFPIEFSAETDYGELANPEVIDYIGSAYAEGLGPWKNSFILREPLEEAVDGDGDGVAQITSQLTGEVLPLVEWAHDAGMQVHPYTLRVEENFLTLNPDGTPQTLADEARQLIEIGVDGIFIDNPDIGDQVRDQIVAEIEDGQLRSTNFRRPEDIHEDPNNPGTFYLVTTGRPEKNGSLTEDAETPEEADNPYGKLHRLILNPEDPTGEATFEFLLEGGPETGVSYDNMTVDSNGNVLIQEDETSFGGDILNAEGRYGSIISYNIAENEGVVGDDQVDFLFENSTAFIDPTRFGAYGSWESSGIIEVPGGYLFDVQAGTIRDTELPDGSVVGTNAEGTVYYQGQYARGGQLLLTLPAEMISGSGEFVGGDAGEILTGSADMDTVAGGLGDDLIDGGEGDDVLRGDANRRSPGGTIGGNDEIYGGPGDDRIGGKGGNDFLFGEVGDDEIFGDDGDDLLDGGLGNDTLTGDDFSGGEGRDTFVLATGEGTDLIVDFEVGMDFLGLKGGLMAEELSFTQAGSDTEVGMGSEVIAILEGVNSNELTALISGDNDPFLTV